MTEFFGLTLILIVALIFVYVAILKPEIRNIIIKFSFVIFNGITTIMT
jgi:hypothetical protein